MGWPLVGSFNRRLQVSSFLEPDCHFAILALRESLWRDPPRVTVETQVLKELPRQVLVGLRQSWQALVAFAVLL